MTGNDKGLGIIVVVTDQGKYMMFNLARVLHLLRGRPSVQCFLKDGTGGEDPRRGFGEEAYA